MKTINVKLKEKSHDIVVGSKILSKAGSLIKKLKIGNDAIIITNTIIDRHHGRKLRSSLRKSGISSKVLIVPAGEKSKSSKAAEKLIHKIANYDVYKKPFIIAFGGGVVGDLAGYVAAVYKRGIPYVQIPTTFLAQIDSAIGGKVAIDLPMGKNLVGAFYQPKLVLSDIDVLKSLSMRQMRNGLAEAVKYGVIKDAKLFSLLEEKFDEVLDCQEKTLIEVVLQCSKIKARVVEIDEFEKKGVRSILNFGHTLGHAIESAVKYDQYQHGEAIALGMRAAVDLSVEYTNLNKAQAFRINDLLTLIGLPNSLKGVGIKKIIDRMKHDKKFVAGKNRFVLADKIGSVRLVEGLNLNRIKSAVKKLY